MKFIKSLLVSSVIVTQILSAKEIATTPQETVSTEELVQASQQPSFQDISYNTTENYPFFNMQGSFALQGIGYGYKWHNLETAKGHALCANMNIFNPLIYHTGLSYLYPTARYSYLMYDAPRDPSYFGLGLELGYFLDLESYERFTKRSYPIPNLVLIWGKERDSVRFSQLEVNVLPLAFATYNLALSTRGSSTDDFESLGHLMLASAIAPAIVSFSVGF